MSASPIDGVISGPWFDVIGLTYLELGESLHCLQGNGILRWDRSVLSVLTSGAS